ncbi:MAG: hypothetical protein ACLFVT_08450 [Syntrophobacteria bacterium]
MADSPVPESGSSWETTPRVVLPGVRSGAQGDFTVLYVPFDRVGDDKNEIHHQALADLTLVVQGIRAMLTA